MRVKPARIGNKIASEVVSVSIGDDDSPSSFSRSSSLPDRFLFFTGAADTGLLRDACAAA